MNGKRLDRSLGAVGSITLQQARVALGVIIEELESKSPVETDDRPTFADILPEALVTFADRERPAHRSESGAVER